MAQNVDFPILFIRADLVDNTKSPKWVYAQVQHVKAVSGYYQDRATAREALVAKLAADMEANYKSSSLPSVYYSFTTAFQTGPNCEVLFASTSAGTAGSATTVSITADSASTAVNCSATSAGAVTIKVPATSANAIIAASATVNLVIAAVAADTGTTAHAATWITAALPLGSDGSGAVKNLAASTLVDETQVKLRKEAFMSATLAHGVK